jgi:hypothetical protein
MWLKKATAGGIGQYQWTDPETPVEVPDHFGGQLLAIPGNDFTEVLTPAPAVVTQDTASDAAADEDAGEQAEAAVKPAAGRRGRTPVRE